MLIPCLRTVIYSVNVSQQFGEITYSESDSEVHLPPVQVVFFFFFFGRDLNYVIHFPESVDKLFAFTADDGLSLIFLPLTDDRL